MSKSIFITGAASGVGRETARIFHKQGWQLGLVDVNTQALDELKKELDSDTHWFSSLNVCDEAEVKTALHDFAQHAGGNLDILFNCAGILEVGRFDEIDLARHHLIMDINIKGLLSVTYHALPYLKATPNAKIINMSSASSLQGTPMFASYSASKFAVRSLTEGLNIELEKDDIEVVAIVPPFVNTPMVQNQKTEAPIAKRLGSHIHPSDVAKKVWSVANKRRNPVHNPITLFLKATILTTKWLPNRINRMIMVFMSRD